jgi:hypothetical protein
MNGLTVLDPRSCRPSPTRTGRSRRLGDFDGDGKSDVILRNKSTGQNVGWLMNGLTVVISAFLPTIADTNWEMVGVGDFNGDSKTDVILRNKSTGQNIGWLMNGLTVSLARVPADHRRHELGDSQRPSPTVQRRAARADVNHAEQVHVGQKRRLADDPERDLTASRDVGAAADDCRTRLWEIAKVLGDFVFDGNATARCHPMYPAQTRP